jgi:hypothetical protein
MSFLKNIFKKEETISSYDEFWNWFQRNERGFFTAVKKHKSIEKDFFDKLAPKLNQVKEEIYYLTGMFDDNTAELILTAEGMIRNIVFVEELINAAPKINGWKFTALKPSLDIKDVSIEMAGYKFHDKTLGFYANDLPEYPDEIDITIIHKEWNEEDKTPLTSGTYIFLDNFLGELAFAETIDNLRVVGTKEAKKEIVPVEKLKEFLKWRQREFIEKYEGERYNTDDDNYSVLEAKLQSGKALLAVINTDLLDWDSKPSHPWVLICKIKYDGSKNNGMPDKETYKLLDEIEDKITEELKDFDGHLNIGRQTSDNTREIYFACKDFRKPSKIVEQIRNVYTGKIDMNYDIHKAKYWQSFERFNRH